MPISSQKARAICTKAEYDFYRASLPKNVTARSAAVLKRDVVRARTLRDKYRALAKTQEREARGKAKPRGKRPAQGSANTRIKAQLFEETLARFQAQAKAVAASVSAKASKAKGGKRPPGRKTAVEKKATAKRGGRKRKAGPKREKAATPADRLREAKARKAAAKAAAPKPKPARKTKPESRVQATGLAAEHAAKQKKLRRGAQTRIRTHISSRGRRKQARRDARR